MLQGHPVSARTAPQWPDDRHPTATEWVDWFLANSREGQEEIAAQAIGDMAAINHCLASRCCWIDR